MVFKILNGLMLKYLKVHQRKIFIYLKYFVKYKKSFYFDSASIGGAMLILHIQYCTLWTRNVYFKTDIF